MSNECYFPLFFSVSFHVRYQHRRQKGKRIFIVLGVTLYTICLEGAPSRRDKKSRTLIKYMCWTSYFSDFARIHSLIFSFQFNNFGSCNSEYDRLWPVLVSRKVHGLRAIEQITVCVKFTCAHIIAEKPFCSPEHESHFSLFLELNQQL